MNKIVFCNKTLFTGLLKYSDSINWIINLRIYSCILLTCVLFIGFRDQTTKFGYKSAQLLLFSARVRLLPCKETINRLSKMKSQILNFAPDWNVSKKARYCKHLLF